MDFSSLAREPYERRGILNSEMALILVTCRELGIKVMIESGRARGQSTYILAKYLPDVIVHSVEARPGPDTEFGIARLAGMPNVALHTGDGGVLLPKLASASDLPTAILLDGPKGERAVNVLAECFAYPHVRVGFIHDMRRLDYGAPSPHRAAAVNRFPNAAFSDDGIADHLKWLDDASDGAPFGEAHERQYGSYGPTLAMVHNS